MRQSTVRQQNYEARPVAPGFCISANGRMRDLVQLSEGSKSLMAPGFSALRARQRMILALGIGTPGGL